MKMINLNFFLKNSLFMLIFIFTGCQAQHSTFEQRTAIYKLVEKAVEPKDKNNISKKETKNEKIVKKSTSTKKKKLLETQINDIKGNKTDDSKINKKKEKIISSLKNFLQKSSENIIPYLGNPSLVIKHGNTMNYQYHLSFCFVDLFFLKNRDNFILNHYELRPIKLNSKFKKNLCKKEIYKLLNKI